MSLPSLQLLYSYFLSGTPAVIGSALIFTGCKGFINSPNMAIFFGIPEPTQEEIVLMQSATGRNLGAGIFVWTMTLLGERKVLGIFLLCWMWAGFADTKVLFQHPQGEKHGIHIQNTVFLLILGSLLIISGER